MHVNGNGHTAASIVVNRHNISEEAVIEDQGTRKGWWILEGYGSEELIKLGAIHLRCLKQRRKEPPIYVPEPRFRGESFAEGDASTDEDLTFLANLPNLGRRLATRQRICVLFKSSVPSAGHLMLPLVSDRASAPPKPHLSGSVTSRPLTRNVLSPQQGALKLFI